MRPVIPRFALGARLIVAALMAMLVSAGPAAAQSASPSSSRGPGVAGQVTGALVTGSRLTIRVDATMPGGWQALHLVEMAVVSGEGELERLRFDIEDNKLTLGEQDIVVGTGAVASGEYLRVSGAEVVVTTGGANLSFEVDAHVVEAIPEGARFELSVADDLGASDQVSRSLAEPKSGGITWEIVIALIAAALFLGGLIGNLFASKRRPPVRPSVYETVRQRLERERAAEASKP